MTSTYLGTNGNDNKTSGYDYLYGLDGNDRLAADAPGYDIVDGGRGWDFLYFANGSASTYGAIYGGEGSDTLVGHRLGDSLYGGEDSDLILGGRPVAYPTDGSQMAGNPGYVSGDDYIEGGNGTDALYGFDEDDRIYGGDGDDGDKYGNLIAPGYTYYADIGDFVETKAGLFGGSGDDYLDGGDGQDDLYGGAGIDRLIGGDGEDTLDGGSNADRMSGGDDNDIFFVGSSGDKVIEGADEGSDLVRTSTNYTLAAGQSVEKLYTASESGKASLKLAGNEIGNILRGNAGDNTLDGKAGNDTLSGLSGKDSFLFSTALVSNVDRIKDFSHVYDTIKLDNAVFKALPTGALKGAAFRDITNASALDADDRILYNHDTGRLYYDADGSGSAAKVQFAILDTSPILAANDFVVV